VDATGALRPFWLSHKGRRTGAWQLTQTAKVPEYALNACLMQ